MSINTAPTNLEAADLNQSLFYKLLPRELRLIIFEYVIGNRVIHLGLGHRDKEDFPYGPRPLKEWCWWHGTCTNNEIPGRPYCKGQYYYARCRSAKEVLQNTIFLDFDDRKIRKRFSLNLALLTVCKEW